MPGRLDGTSANENPYIILNDGRLNSFIGLNAGLKLVGSKQDIGRRNVYVGANVGASSTFVSNSVFVGARTGELARTVEAGVFVGSDAGSKTRESVGDTLVGFGAGAVIQKSSYNCLIGYKSGSEFLSGTRVTAVGAFSALYNQSCRDCTYVGHLAGANQRRNDLVTAVGAQSGNASVGSSTTLVGWSAGAGLRGNQATVVGVSAGVRATGDRTVFVGHSSGVTFFGDENTGVGWGAMGSNEAGATAGRQGSRNTGIGYLAGNKLVGNDNTLLGSKSCPSLRGNNNAFLGGNMLLATKEWEILPPPAVGATIPAQGVAGYAAPAVSDASTPITVTCESSAAVGQDVDVRLFWPDFSQNLVLSNVALLGSQLYFQPATDGESAIISTNARVLKANRTHTTLRTGITVSPPLLDNEILLPTTEKLPGGAGREDVWFDSSSASRSEWRWRPSGSTGPSDVFLTDVGVDGGFAGRVSWMGGTLVEACGYGPNASMERYGVLANAASKCVRVFAGEAFTADKASVRLSVRTPTFNRGAGNVITAVRPEGFLTTTDVLVADREGVAVAGGLRAGSLAGTNLAPGRALVSAAGSLVATASKTTATEVDYLHGVRSNVQSQIDAIVANLPDAVTEAKPPGPALSVPDPPSAAPHPIPVGGVGGWVLVQVSSLPGAATAKAGSLLFSYMPSAGNPFTAYVRKSQSLETLSLGRYELGVALQTDADCEVAWSYVGYQGMGGGDSGKTTVIILPEAVGVQHVVVSDASGAKVGSALVSHFPDPSESAFVSAKMLSRHASAPLLAFAVVALSATSLAVVADAGVYVTHTAGAQGLHAWSTAGASGEGFLVPQPDLPSVLLVQVKTNAVPSRYCTLMLAFADGVEVLEQHCIEGLEVGVEETAEGDAQVVVSVAEDETAAVKYVPLGL